MNTTIIPGSLYRFATGTDHKRTAVALKDGRFLEVKPTRQMFVNGDAWSVSFMGEGATLSNGITTGKITVELRRSSIAKPDPVGTKDLQRLAQIHQMYAICPTMSSRYIRRVKGQSDGKYGKYEYETYLYYYETPNRRNDPSVLVMDIYGGLHSVGFSPKRGGNISVHGYKNGKTLKVAQRFSDISPDFAEDAPLYVEFFPAGYNVKCIYHVNIEGIPLFHRRTVKTLYLITPHMQVLREFIRNTYTSEVGDILRRIQDAGYLVSVTNTGYTMSKYFNLRYHRRLPLCVKHTTSSSTSLLDLVKEGAKLVGV